MAKARRVNPAGVHTPQANYSHVARVGDTLYISGQLPLDLDGNLVGLGDPEAQAEQCYRNIQHIVEYFGGSLDDIVKINQYVTDISHRPLLARPRDRLLGTPGPASTLVAVTALAVPKAVIEIEAIAVLE
jgi:enamine deaminase RidA (YjgF/YER057c/UK114 family)